MSRVHGSSSRKSIHRSAIAKMAAAFLVAFCASVAVEAAPCGQQSVLKAISPLGAAAVASVKRDQQRLASVAADSARALRSSGIDEQLVRKLLGKFQSSVPVYCVLAPNLPDHYGAVPPSVAHHASAKYRPITKFISDMKRQYQELPNNCSDCKTSDQWQHRYDVAMRITSLHGRMTNEYLKEEHENFVKYHRRLTIMTVRNFVDLLEWYRL